MLQQCSEASYATCATQALSALLAFDTRRRFDDFTGLWLNFILVAHYNYSGPFSGDKTWRASLFTNGGLQKLNMKVRSPL